MTRKDTKIVKVYAEDWKALNQYLSILQLERGKRLSFADTVNEIVQKYVVPYMNNFMKANVRSET